MPNKLTILSNELNKKPEDQLVQVSVALDTIQNWANNNNPRADICIQDTDTTNLVATDTSYKQIGSLKNVLNMGATTFFYSVKLLLDSTDISSVGVYIDGNLLTEIPFYGRGLVSYTGYGKTTTGLHYFSLMWKTKTGTMTKYPATNTLEIIQWSN